MHDRRPLLIVVALVGLLVTFLVLRRLILGPPAEMLVGLTLRGADAVAWEEVTLVIDDVWLSQHDGRWVRLSRHPTTVTAGEVAENRFLPISESWRGAGRYDRIRLHVAEAYAREGGGRKEVRLLSDEIALSLPIELVRGETSSVTLALSLAASLRTVPGGEVALLPQISVESRRGISYTKSESGLLDLSGGSLLFSGVFGVTESAGMRLNYRLPDERVLSYESNILSVIPEPRTRIEPSSLRPRATSTPPEVSRPPESIAPTSSATTTATSS